ncbi:hypothetical protein niasHT_037079 [Heterodera trifolii]|uniref:ShKT domain-containing protein n=1 Tax=Heterodera trifolii TaxID=157864 RepID=A0ABD2IRP7_9BILA
MPATSLALLCFCVAVVSSFCCLSAAFPPPPSSFSSLTQPPLTNSVSASLSSQIKPKCVSPLNRLLFCLLSSSSCAPPTKYPFAGWSVTSPSSVPSSATSVAEEKEEKQIACFDQSSKCADFAKLCSDSLYRLFLHTHCALSCGFCGNGTVSGRGIGKGVRAPTKRAMAKPTQKVPKSTEQTVGTTSEAMKVDTTTNGQSTEEEKCEWRGRKKKGRNAKRGGGEERNAKEGGGKEEERKECQKRGEEEERKECQKKGKGRKGMPKEGGGKEEERKECQRGGVKEEERKECQRGGVKEEERKECQRGGVKEEERKECQKKGEGEERNAKEGE